MTGHRSPSANVVAPAARRRGASRRHRWRAVAAVLCSGLSVFLIAARTVNHASLQVYYATVNVTTTGKPIGAITDKYIGLSFESGTLNSGRFNANGNLPRLLSNLGSSVMRFGGNTVDTTYAGITPQALTALARLANAAGWSVLYSEDLGHFNGAQVTADARAVTAALGSKLVAIGCGNEPDEYTGDGLRQRPYPMSRYLAEVGACYHAIRAGAPGVPLEGPDTASFYSFLSAYLGRADHTISLIGQHYYALGCRFPVTDPAAWAGTLLSPGLADAEAAKLGSYTALARSAHLPLMITESNSACHGGIQGLSDSYAATLWAIDFLLTGAEHGVAAMEFHGGLNNSCAGYTVLCKVGTDTYGPQPVYYGMLFTHLLGTGTMWPVTVSTTAKLANLTAFALKPAAGGLRVMVENLSSAQASVALHHVGFVGAGSILRLAGPSLLATSGVTIQGQSIAADGSFTPSQPGSFRCRPSGCAVSLPPYSAAVLTLG